MFDSFSIPNCCEATGQGVVPVNAYELYGALYTLPTRTDNINTVNVISLTTEIGIVFFATI